MNLAKSAAGIAAAALVLDGMTIGLGSGTTMRHVVTELGRRVRAEGLRVVGVPTSTQTEAWARDNDIAVTELDGRKLDLAIDGADEVERGTLRLIKGLGGALLREKIVAEASVQFVIVADSSKVVPILGSQSSLPVEIARFGQAAIVARMAALGGRPVLRRDADGAVFETDGGNAIADCVGFAPIRDPYTLERDLRAIAGVMGTGLFLRPVGLVLVGHADGSVSELVAR